MGTTGAHAGTRGFEDGRVHALAEQVAEVLVHEIQGKFGGESSPLTTRDSAPARTGEASATAAA